MLGYQTRREEIFLQSWPQMLTFNLFAVADLVLLFVFVIFSVLCHCSGLVIVITCQTIG